MSTTAETERRDEYRNDSAGIIGVTLYDEEGKRQGIAVRPGESVFMTERDRVATANAPKRDADNPFLNGLTFIRAADDMKDRRVITSPEPSEDATPVEPDASGPVAPPEEVKEADYEDLTPPAPGTPEEGVRAANEEVASPEVVAKAGTEKRQGRGTTVRSGNPAAKKPPSGPAAVVVGQNGPQYQSPPTEE